MTIYARFITTRVVVCHPNSVAAPEDGGPLLERRISRGSFLKGALLFPAVSCLLNTKPANSEVAPDVVLYDLSYGLSLSYPSSWTSVEGIPGSDDIVEKTLFWYPKDAFPRDVNVSLRINNTAADYTALGSFGTAVEFGENLVNSMDQSYLASNRLGRQLKLEDIQTARLVSARSQKGMYMIEYLLKKPEEIEKRLLSLVALGNDGRYNRLYTLTAQCSVRDYPKYENDIQSILQSFKPPSRK